MSIYVPIYSFVRRHITSIALASCVLLSSLPFLWGSLPVTNGHDLIYHLERIESIANGLARGHFPVWLYANQAYGYGYPAGVCYPSLFILPFAALRLLGLSLQDAYRALVLVVNVATTAVAHASFRHMFRSRRTALACTTLWVLAPYRLCDVWLRAAVGEYLALVFVPLIAYGLWRICLDASCRPQGLMHGSSALSMGLNGTGADGPMSRMPTWLPLALGMAGVVQSHVLSVLLLLLPGLPLVVVLLVLGMRRHPLRRMLSLLAMATLACVCLCANVIVPLFSYSLGETMFATVVAGWGIPAERALEPHQVIGAFWPFRGTSTTLAEGTENDMPTPVGCALTVAFLAGAWLLVRRRPRESLSHERRVLLASLLALAVVLAFATTRFFPWWLYQSQSLAGALVRAVGVIQFPWRFIGPLCFVLALVAGMVFNAVGAAGAGNDTPGNVVGGRSSCAKDQGLVSSRACGDADGECDIAIANGADAVTVGTSVSNVAANNVKPSRHRRVALLVACTAICVVEAAYDNVSFAVNADRVTQTTISDIEAHNTWSIGFGEYLNANFDANARDAYGKLLTGAAGVAVNDWNHDDVVEASLYVANEGAHEASVTVPVLYNRFWQVTSAGANASAASGNDGATVLRLAEVDGYLALRVPAGFAGTVHLAFVAPASWYVAFAVSLVSAVAVAWLWLSREPTPNQTKRSWHDTS